MGVLQTVVYMFGGIIAAALLTWLPGRFRSRRLRPSHEERTPGARAALRLRSGWPGRQQLL